MENLGVDTDRSEQRLPPLRRVLVTGHAGYIGSVLVRLLAASGYSVVGLDTYFYRGCNLGPYEESVGAIQKDVREIERHDLEGFDAIVHFAALCNDPLGSLYPQLTLDINYKASVRMAMLARDAGVRRFVYASSCSMYGASGGDDRASEDSPLRPLTTYAESKARSEEAISQLADKDFSPVYMRNATAYGFSPAFRSDLVLNNLACWGYTTRKIKIISNGQAWRPLVHVEDISRAVAAVLAAPRGSIHNQAFNVGVEGENYQVIELAEIIRAAMSHCEIEYAGRGEADARNYRVEFQKIKNILPNFAPRWSVRRGVRELLQGFSRTDISAEAFESGRFTRISRLRHLVDCGRLSGDLHWTEDTVIGASAASK